MAPVLQCPDCGQKHPIDAIGDVPAFRCKGCGRMLKLPEQLRVAKPDEAPPPPAVFPPRPVPPTMRERRKGPVGNELPRFVRVLIWFVAVPLGFVLVFGTTRALGLLSQRQLEDAFLLSGWNRFWPIVRVLPFWALITAVIVHFGNIGIVQWRRARHERSQRPKPPGGGRASRKPINGRPPRQSATQHTSATSGPPTRTTRVP
jgi:hypothetical protein